jgi:hypothetical protein
MARILGSASVAVIAGVVDATGIAAASAATRPASAVSGTEHIQVVSSSPGAPASAIAYGVFTAGGVAHLGNARIGTLVLQGGTITLSHTPGQGTHHFSPRTCLSSVSQPGTYKIVGGTGRFKGITGHGTYRLTFMMVGAKVNGACSPSKPPIAQQELLRLSGHVQL